MPLRIFSFFFFFSMLFGTVQAQSIMGELQDIDSHEPISDVQIENIHNNASVVTDKAGRFLIAAASGQLILFKKNGYKTASVRIPAGTVPSYFKILLQKGVTDISKEYANNKHDWKTDSTKYYELYRTELEFPKMSGLDVIEHPFSAMSSRSREIWEFQRQYDNAQQQKYIDYRFSNETVTRLTGLQGDSLNLYLRKFRPSYPMARSMNDYNMYGYITRTVLQYRKGGHSYQRLSR
ncbi:MAG: hypothetical protein H0X33_09645 [Taibaiella sp.]|nr:hypothetical protein [Taibaiella sp.]